LTTKQSGVRGKVRDGTVVSDKMQKTVIVAVEANYRHRLYKKTVRRVRRLMAHDERGEAQLGDRVRIAETSPVSRRKRWRLLQVLVKAELPEVAPESIDLELLGEVKAEEPEVEAAPAGEPVPAEAVAAPETEAVVPEEVEVAEEVPEIEAAVEEEQPASAEAEVTEAEPEGSAEAEELAEAEQEEEPAQEAPEAEGAGPEAESESAENLNEGVESEEGAEDGSAVTAEDDGEEKAQ
jgi:small subunit ribosomal protein S17